MGYPYMFGTVPIVRVDLHKSLDFSQIFVSGQKVFLRPWHDWVPSIIVFINLNKAKQA